MKRVVLSIGVATLLVCGTLVASGKNSKPVSAHEMNERRAYALAEQEYAEEVELLGGLDTVQEISSEEDDASSREEDVAVLKKPSQKASRYQKDADHKRRKAEVSRIAQKEFSAWKKSDIDERKKQARHQRRTLRAQKDEQLSMRIDAQHRDRLLHAKKRSEDRQALMAEWDRMHRAACEQEIAHGRYADLYKVPAWPTAALFFENMGWINATVSYTYATDAYNSSGENKDVSILEFGEQPIKVKDLLLASKLVSEKKLTQQEFNDATITIPVPTSVASDTVFARDVFASKYLDYLANQEVKFLGQAEEVKINFDLVRYIFRNDFAFGVQLPLLYRKNRLKAHLDIQSDETLSAAGNPTGLFGLVKDGLNIQVYHPAGSNTLAKGHRLVPNAFMRRYGQNTDLFLQDIWKAKGIDSLGGSAMGLGDIAFFMHGNIKSAHFDRMVVGAKVLVPFAKKSSPRRLWGPALGNDGHTEFSVFSSVLFSHRQFINPHFFVQTLFNAPSRNEKRVPKRIANPANNLGGDRFVRDLAGKALFAFADRVQLENGVAKGAKFNDFDTTRKNLGDNITALKMWQGLEVQFRAGNMIEHFLSRRGFLDLYYFFRFKAADDIRGIDIQEWNPSVFEDNTKELEHTAGLDYSYQFDHDTRLVAGLLYTFAGQNVPKTFNARISLGFSFK